MAASDPLHLIGATLAQRYAIDSVVRVEAGTVVYRATHLPSNRSVAVRVLVAVAALPQAKRKALTQRLADDHATLNELGQIIPAACPLRDVGLVGTPQGTVPFVALDWPHGITLRHMVQPDMGAAPFPESIDGVVAMLEPVAVALAIAHEHGVVHGGITSDRVLFREDGPDGTRRATLLDFGVAAVLRAVDGESDPVPADDVRALASIVSQVMARSCGADSRLDDTRSPRERGVAVSDEVEAVFTRALGADPFPRVGELWSALRLALGLATLRSLQVTIPPESPQPSASLHPFARASAPTASRTVRDAVFYGVGAFALLVAGGLTLEHVLFDGTRASAATPRPVAAAPTTPCASGMLAAGGERVTLGAPGDLDEPARKVTLSPFCIDREAVTNGAYKACSDRGGCAPAPTTNEWDGISAEDHEVLDPFCSGRDPSQAARPANCLTWEMARAFCEQRGGRLPTEAEWGLASRATAAGIAEWTGDFRAPLTADDANDPAGPAAGEERVVRGPHAIGARPTRFGATPATRSHAIGFRCATPR